MNLEDGYSTSSSSSSSSVTATSSSPSPTNVKPISHKRKAGRKKFRETRHPIYRCVRRRNGNKWVCEVREPNKKSRIWVGTFSSPEIAARAHDIAAIALRGEMAALNFSDSSWLLPRAKSSSASDIQIAALETARAFQLAESPSSSSSSSTLNFSPSLSSGKVMRPPTIWVPNVKCGKKVLEISSMDSEASEKVSDSSTTQFLDEEALFNLPGLLDSMAEGLLLTPPAMKSGFNWDDLSCDMELNLWGD
uniref:AP2/ERF transcription factor n=1 Tax=Camptotheca acuminata TaxID=16922 RepID=A0A7G8AUB4_CAMAC|nr:AP2/ERF transcription factor [Camptotheca acuminata]